MSNPEYTKLGIACDLSMVSLQEAALVVGPAFVYNLYVHRSRLWFARNLVRQHTTETMTNPFAPVINVQVAGVNPDEWFLQTPRGSCGSSGVT